MSDLLNRFYQDVDKFMLDKMIDSLRIMKFAQIDTVGKEVIIKYIGSKDTPI
jgi:hypothetical protein